MTRRQKNNEQGSILGMAAISMVAILLMVGLSIDIGHWYVVGAELQNAADAAALAAASALNSKAGGITQAADRAVATVNKYEFNGTTATIARSNVRFAVNLSDFDSGGTGMSEADALGTPQNIRFVQVTIPPKAVSVFFVSMVTNSTTVNLSRKAVAGLSVDINYVCNLVPLAVIQNDDNPSAPVPLSVSPGCPNTLQYTPGCTYTIRMDGGSSVAPGKYLILNIASDRGGSDTRERLAVGGDSCYSAGESLSSGSGLKAGAVRQGFNTRFDQYAAGLDPATYPPDANVRENITYDQYKQSAFFTAPPAHPPGIWDRRVFVLPIINMSQYVGASGTMTVSRFGVFFLQSAVGNGSDDIVAEYIGDAVALGNGGFNPNGGTGFTGLTIPVLYR